MSYKTYPLRKQGHFRKAQSSDFWNQTEIKTESRLGPGPYSLRPRPPSLRPRPPSLRPRPFSRRIHWLSAVALHGRRRRNLNVQEALAPTPRWVQCQRETEKPEGETNKQRTGPETDRLPFYHFVPACFNRILYVFVFLANWRIPGTRGRFYAPSDECSISF